MLSDEDLTRFGQEGYLVLPGVVSEDLLAGADAEINAVVTQAPPPPGTVGHHFYFRPPASLRAADAAFRRSGAIALAEHLVVGPHRVHHAFDHIQIALNIPYKHRPGGPHIDGHRPSQLRPGSFTMLAAVSCATSLSRTPATCGSGLGRVWSTKRCSLREAPGLCSP